MAYYFWPAEHATASLVLVAAAILVFAWPAENVTACVVAAVMMGVATGMMIRRHFIQPSS